MSSTIPGVLILQAFAASGDAVTDPPQTDPSGFVNWTQGYTPFYEISLAVGNPAAKAVERAVQNGLFNLITANQINWQQLGFSQWWNSMPGGYMQNAMVFRWNGTTKWVPYRSLVDNNVADPLTSPTNWEYIPFGHESLANVPMPSGGPSGPSGEVITTATDFNSFTTGTWQYQTDAIAAASAHSPVPLGGAAAAGLLESCQWSNGAGTYSVQRYLDRNGNTLYRAATGSTWTAWASPAAASNYTVDTSGTVNLVSGTLPLASSSLPDNKEFWVKIANTNTGAVTFTPNPSVIPTALPVVGQSGLALQGGEIVASGRAKIIYKADTNNYVLQFCSGGVQQGPTATQGNQIPNLTQVNAAIDQYAVDTGAVNAIAVTYAPAVTSGNLRDNQKFWVKVANTNTGATTFTPGTGIAAKPVVGSAGIALQGGELTAGGRAEFIWNASAASFYLTETSNGAVQVGTATQTQQATTLAQVQSMLSSVPSADGVLYRLGYLM